MCAAAEAEQGALRMRLVEATHRLPQVNPVQLLLGIMQSPPSPCLATAGTSRHYHTVSSPPSMQSPMLVDVDSASLQSVTQAHCTVLSDCISTY